MNKVRAGVLAAAMTASALALGTTQAQAAALASPASLCGSGYSVIDSHVVTGYGATVYLLFNGTRNCVVTLKTSNLDKKTVTMALVQTPGNPSHEDSDYYYEYAGPVYSEPSAGKCIRWGGGQTYKWESDWEHCG